MGEFSAFSDREPIQIHPNQDKMKKTVVLILITISVACATSRVHNSALSSEVEKMNSNMKKVLELLETMHIAVPPTIDDSEVNYTTPNDTENLQRLKRNLASHPLAFIKNKISSEIQRLKASGGIKLEHSDRRISYIDIDFKIRDVFEKKFIDKSEKLNKKILHTSVSYVTNESHLRQQGYSASFAEKITKTNTVTVSKTKEISGDVKIPLIDNSKIALKFSQTDTTTDTKSTEVLISAPAQKVEVDPFSKVKTTFKLSSYDDIYNYLIDFEIDSSSEIKIQYGAYTASSYAVDFWPPSEELSLVKFLTNNRNFVNSIEYGSDNEIKIAYHNGRFVLENFPLEERVRSSELEVVVGRQEKL